MDDKVTSTPPRVFISYSWDDEHHKRWTKALSARLREDGIAVTLDQWELVPGDQLPHFMETAIRDNTFVIIICTPNYKQKADGRKGGVGYEGDIMTAEVLGGAEQRKFIPVLRAGQQDTAMPTWLRGKYSIDLYGDPYSEEQYRDLLTTLFNRREKAPPVGQVVASRSSREAARTFLPTKEEPADGFEPIRIEGVILDEVGEPKQDGTHGSALYAVPLKLSRTPTHDWGDLFVKAWDHPSQFSFKHRPGIARIQGDRVVLTGTTIEELRDVHRNTLRLAVEEANAGAAELARRRAADRLDEQRRTREHKDNIRRVGEDLTFD